MRLSNRTNKTPKIKILSAFIVLLVTIIYTIITPKAVNAARYSVSVIDACNMQYGLSTFADIVEWNVWGRRCFINGSNGIKNQGGVSLWTWCQKTYGRAYGAYYDDWGNPYSWYCDLQSNH